MSGVEKKARCDSRLKVLPEERQGAIIEFMREHSLAETVSWLRQDGIRTSAAALSEFYSWHRLRQQLRRNEGTVQALMSELGKREPGLATEKVQEIGQAFFTALALEQQDVRSWHLTQQIGLKRGQLDLDRQKFRRETAELFLKWSEDQRAREIAGSGATNAEKIERLGQLMFGATW